MTPPEKGPTLKAMLSALILILPGFSLQESLPHPTLPVRSGTWPPATAKVDSSRAWVCLNPSWMPQATEDGKERRFLSERNSRGRIAQRLMQSEGWTEAEAGAWMRAAAPGAVALEFALTRGDEILFSGREVVTPGTPIVVSDLLKVGGIADIDVEIAQGSAIGDPLGADSDVAPSSQYWLTKNPEDVPLREWAEAQEAAALGN